MTGKMFKTCAVGMAVAGLVFLTSRDAQAVVTYDIRALSGDTAPGTDPSVVYFRFENPVLNSAGQTAFLASLTGAGVDGTNGGGIWSEGSGSLSLVARDGDAVPGTVEGVAYNFLLDAPVLNDAGQAAFRGNLTGTGVDSTNRFGIWSGGSGSLSLVARAGDAAPGTAEGGVYKGFGFPVLNDAGQTAFFGNLTGAGVNFTNDAGIWSEGSGSLNLVARKGSPAPGTARGAVYGSHLSDPVLNGAGQIAFFGFLTGAGVDSTNDRGIWSEGSGELSLVARSGNAAPGTAPGVVFRSFGAGPVLNDAGQTAFLGLLAGPGLENDVGIWSEGSGSLRLVARGGTAAPGTAAGEVFSSLGSPVLNGAGQIAFRSSIAGPNVNSTNFAGIWSEGSGSLSLVARIGDTAPGADPGEVFAGMDAPVLNGAGQIAFAGALSGTDVDNTNDRGLWGTDHDGLLTLIAREGDVFDVNDDPLIYDLRTIRFVSMAINSGGEDGRGTSFNDAGQLAFRLIFTNGSSGIFVATIPEPGTVGVLGVLVGMLLRRRGRRGG